MKKEKAAEAEEVADVGGVDEDVVAVVVDPRLVTIAARKGTLHANARINLPKVLPGRLLLRRRIHTVGASTAERLGTSLPIVLSHLATRVASNQKRCQPIRPRRRTSQKGQVQGCQTRRQR